MTVVTSQRNGNMYGPRFRRWVASRRSRTRIPDELMVGSYIVDLGFLESLPNGRDSFKPHSQKFRTVAEGNVQGKSFKRLHRWRYSPTAAYENREVHLHPIEYRRLTVREVMRIQSVPDNYALPEEMTLGKKFKIISNAVPVTLVRRWQNR